MDNTYIFDLAMRYGFEINIQPYTDKGRTFAITMSKDGCSSSTVLILDNYSADPELREQSVKFILDTLAERLKNMLSIKERSNNV